VANSGQFAPGHGKVGGRKRGGKNKVGADVRQAAQVYTTDAIDTLAGIMHDAEAPHAARVMASDPARGVCRELPGDRREGKIRLARQSIGPLGGNFSARYKKASCGRKITAER
jgi:hypothetical protein